MGLAWTLALVGELELARGRLELAAKLFGAMDNYRASLRGRSPFGTLEQHKINIAAVRARLGDAAFETAWAKGCSMTLEQAARCALDAGGVSPDLNYSVIDHEIAGNGQD